MLRKNNETNIKKFYKKFNLKSHAEESEWGKLRDMPAIIKLLGNRKKILDLACGYGRLSLPLAKAGYDVYGVDISNKLINEAKRNAKKNRAKINFKVGTFLDIPYESEKFEAIIVIWTAFCHLLTKKEQVSGLKEMKRVVKRGGLIIIDVPYYSNRAGIELFEKNDHKTMLFKFNKRWLREISKLAGFKEIEITTYRFRGKNRNWLILKK